MNREHTGFIGLGIFIFGFPNKKKKIAQYFAFNFIKIYCIFDLKEVL